MDNSGKVCSVLSQTSLHCKSNALFLWSVQMDVKLVSELVEFAGTLPIQTWEGSLAILLIFHPFYQCK